MSMNSTNIKHLPIIAYRYNPKETERVNILCDAPIRRIFKCPITSFSDFELKKLLELEEYIISNNHKLPDNYKLEDRLRQLQGNGYKIEESFKEMLHEIEWKQNNLPIQLNDDIEYVLNTGFIYIHGKDNCFRPLIVVNPMKYDKTKYPLETWSKGLYFLIDYLFHNYIIPGKVENWNFIIDCGDLKMPNIPFDLKTMFSNMKGVYRCRLYRLYLLNLKSLFKYLWNIAVALVGSSIEAKATKVDYDDGKFNKLFDCVNRKQVEKKFGGLAEDLKQGQYFPEKFVCNEYYSENDYKNGNIDSKTEIEIINEDGENYYEIMTDEMNN